MRTPYFKMNFVIFEKMCIFAFSFEWNAMNYLQFREQWLDVGCFSIYQLRAWKNDFDSGALSRWVKKGYIAKLRQDWYAFSELQREPDMARFIAGKIYSPSYISLHTALSVYGIIPEAVTQITCVTTNRTASYSNSFGNFHYQAVKPDLFFGYKQELLKRGGCYLIAEPEKAIVDLLYLYPQYNSVEAMRELRFDEWWMQEELNYDKLRAFSRQTSKKALAKRIELLIKAYKND